MPGPFAGQVGRNEKRQVGWIWTQFQEESKEKGGSGLW